MKHLAFVLMLLGFVPAVATGQTPQPTNPEACGIAFEEQEIMLISSAIHAVAQQCNARISIVSKIPEDQVDMSNKSFKTIRGALMFILVGKPYSYKLDPSTKPKKTITIVAKSAQTPQPKPSEPQTLGQRTVITFSKGTSIYQVLLEIARAYSEPDEIEVALNGVRLDRPLANTIGIAVQPGNISLMLEELPKLLDTSRYKFSLDQRTNTLEVSAQNPSAPPLRTYFPAPTNDQTWRAAEPRQTQPDVPGLPPEFYTNPILAAMPRPMGVVSYGPSGLGIGGPYGGSTGLQPSGVVSIPPSGLGIGYAGYGGYVDHSIVQAMIDQDTWGALKFKKGSETFMENVEVRCGDQLITQADEGNNIWDHLVLLPTYCSHSLTFRYTDAGDKDWEVAFDVMIVPLRIQPKGKKITIDADFFNRARRVTEYQKYSMVEQPDGSFKRVPREEATPQIKKPTSH